MKRLLFSLTSLVLLLLPIVSGCAPENENDSVLPGTAGGQLNLTATEPYTLDPAIIGDAGGLTFIAQIFSGLVKVADEGIVPDIAESWTVSEDGTVYTFHLRPDVTFHDGRQVKADDFKYSWERALAPATGSSTARTYLGDIAGSAAVRSGEMATLSGVRVIDDYTLEVTIDSPKSYFLSKMTYATAYVVDRENVAEGNEWWRNPNGTGPFILDQWTNDAYIRLKKNTGFYDGEPKLDSVVFNFLAGRPIDLYEMGNIDIASVDSAYIDRALDTDGAFSGQAQIISQLSLYFLGFNSAEPPFDDPLVRKAFSMALDRDKLVELVFNDMHQAAEGIVPPGIPGYNPSIAGLGYDPGKALELLEASSYGSAENLPDITLTTLGYGGLISAELEAMVYQWSNNLGVEVSVRQLEPEVFLYSLKEERDQIFYQGWIADYPHQQNFLEILFETGADNNWGEYSNPQVDELLEQAATMTEESESELIYQQAEQILISEAALWPYYFGRSYILVKPYIKGYELNPLGVPLLKDVSIDRSVDVPTNLTVS